MKELTTSVQRYYLNYYLDRLLKSIKKVQSPKIYRKRLKVACQVGQALQKSPDPNRKMVKKRETNQIHCQREKYQQLLKKEV